MSPSRSYPAGFTLIEVLVVILIVGILSTLAAPSFRGLIESQRVSNAGYELHALINLARSEAVKRNMDVKVTPVYTAGVVTSIEVTLVSNGTVLATKAAPKGVKITPSPSAANGITFKRNGRVVEDSPNIGIDVAGAAATTNARCMVIGLSGMPRRQHGACP